MKIITTKEYKYLLEKNVELAKSNLELTERLKEAKDLKSILEKLYPMHDFFDKLATTNSVLSISGGGNISLNMPDNVAVYVEDMLGGSVIKQEATKVVYLNKDGSYKSGYTKEKPDKGYSYKLIREN